MSRPGLTRDQRAEVDAAVEVMRGHGLAGEVRVEHGKHIKVVCGGVTVVVSRSPSDRGRHLDNVRSSTRRAIREQLARREAVRTVTLGGTT